MSAGFAEHNFILKTMLIGLIMVYFTIQNEGGGNYVNAYMSYSLQNNFNKFHTDNIDNKLHYLTDIIL